MEQPLVSIVMPSYRKGPYLRAAIESLLAQTYPRVEIIVQDNESDDATHGILEAYRSRLSHVAIEADAGQSDALMRGYARAHGDILGWLNADDMLMPDAITTAVAAFQKEPRPDVVYGHCVFLAADGAFQSYYHDIQPVTADTLGNTGSFICQPGAFFLREAYERIGGVNRDLHFTMDWDLWCRFARSGGRLRMLDEVLAAARVYPETKSLGGGKKRFREILQTNCRYKTTWLPRATLAYLYGAKIRPHCMWLNRIMGVLWRCWTGRSVDGAIIEGVASGRRVVGSQARIRFPLFCNLHGLGLEVIGELESASLNGEVGTLRGNDRNVQIHWHWSTPRFVQTVELILKRKADQVGTARITDFRLDLAPDDPLPS